MINLLPPEIKTETNAARLNRLLLRYNIMVLGALVFSLAFMGVVYIFLVNAKTVAESTIENNIARAGDYQSVESEANTFKTDLTSAKQILDGDVRYTNIILEIAKVLPPGVVLDTLSLDSQTFGTPTTLAANARDYPTVLRLKESLQSSTVFENVSIQTISNSGSGDYPLSATFSVTIPKDATK